MFQIKFFLKKGVSPFFFMLLFSLSCSGQTSNLREQDFSEEKFFNNVIELRNDKECCQGFFTVFCKPSPVRPATKFYLQSRNPDVWVSKMIPEDPGLAEIPLWSIRVEYDKADKLSAGGKAVLINKNVPETLPIEYDACKRETKGCHISPTYKNHGRDWDVMSQKKDEILHEAGLTDSSPEWDKVQAVALWCYGKRKNTENQLGDQPWHPVEHITKGGFCVFAANALVAFCSTMNIPARTIKWSGHTTAEIFIDGQWRWVENAERICDYMLEKHGTGPLFRFSFLEMIENPFKYGIPEKSEYHKFSCLTDEIGGRLLFSNLEAYSKWHFIHGGEGQPQKLITFQSISELKALYPEKDTLMYICGEDKPIMYLLPFDRHDYIQNSYTRKIYQNLGIRQCFYLSSSQHVKRIESVLLLDTEMEEMPPDGGDWYYNINGHKIYLRDTGGWKVQKADSIIREKHIVLDIPLEYLNFEEK